MSETIAVLGSGGWGTTLATVLDDCGHNCRLWAHRPDEALVIAQSRKNSRFLPGITLSDSLQITSDPATALANASVAFIVVPMKSLSENLRAIAPYLPSDTILVSGTKGLSALTGERVSEIATSILGANVIDRWVALSGPNISLEIAHREPTTTVVAGSNEQATQRIQNLFSVPWFRAYTSNDLIGIEIAGGFKNIVAIGAGLADGLQLGHNARASLLTRGLAEMTRLGIHAGANPLTFSGLAGVGDLIATCFSSQSRNHYVGLQLAAGRMLPEIEEHMDTVAEGINTTRGALVLAGALEIELPIAETMSKILFDNMTVSRGIELLMSREQQYELKGIDSGT